jgi:hypothetical protein
VDLIIGMAVLLVMVDLAEEEAVVAVDVRVAVVANVHDAAAGVIRVPAIAAVATALVIHC